MDHKEVNAALRRIGIDLLQAGNYFDRNEHNNFITNLNLAKAELDALVNDYT